MSIPVTLDALAYAIRELDARTRDRGEELSSVIVNPRTLTDALGPSPGARRAAKVAGVWVFASPAVPYRAVAPGLTDRYVARLLDPVAL